MVQREDLTMGVAAGIRYGEVLEAILQAHRGKAKERTVSRPEAIAQLLMMLAARRIDWLLAEPVAAWQIAKERGVADLIAMLPAREHDQPAIAGYVTCPKNQWGGQVIAQINQILRREIASGRYYDLLRPSIDEALLPEFKRQYQRLLVKPALED